MPQAIRQEYIMTKFFITGKKIQITHVFAVLALTLSLTHCTTYDFSRRTVQQGNLLPQANVQKLKIGMSKNDTAILLGTSLLSPTFNTNRWDYAFTRRNGNGPTEMRRLVIIFANDKIVHINHKI